MTNTQGTALKMRAPVTKFFFLVLVTFLIAFPKGGLKVGTIPVTIGYVTLGLVTLIASMRFLVNMHKLPQNALLAWFLTLPFQLTVVVTYLTMGVYKDNVAILLVVSTTFIFMPTAFLLILSSSSSYLEPEMVKKTIVAAIRFICIFGVVLFAVKTFTGHTVEIPFLTVNLDDTDALGSKNNTRGELFKLISTYNNGNILGVCLAMMMPFYFFVEKRKFFFFLAVVCMLLTLSRTVWIGMVLVFMAIAWIDGLKPSRIIGLGILGLFFIVTLLFLVEAMGRSADTFLLDTNLGNRSGYLELFLDFHLEPRRGVGGVVEMVYASIYDNYGLFGFLSFLLFLAAPIAVTLLSDRGSHTLNRAAASGLGIYIIVAMSDGAILLIPTMAIFFFVSLIALELRDEDQSMPDLEQQGAVPAPFRRYRRPRLQALK